MRHLAERLILKNRLKDGERAVEVARKVRDTLAGIIGASRERKDIPRNVETISRRGREADYSSRPLA